MRDSSSGRHSLRSCRPTESNDCLILGGAGGALRDSSSGRHSLGVVAYAIATARRIKPPIGPFAPIPKNGSRCARKAASMGSQSRGVR